MIYPSGVTESQFVDTVNSISSLLCYDYSFGYFDPEDIKQEAFVEAIKVLPKFTPHRGSLGAFLSTHIRNRLLNLQRDKLFRKQNPCLKCQKCATQQEKELCKKYIKWKTRNDAKKGLMESSCLEVDIEEQTFIDDFPVIRNEIVKLIDKNLPVYLRADYRRLVESTKLSKRKTDKIISEIKKILNENGENGKT